MCLLYSAVGTVTILIVSVCSIDDLFSPRINMTQYHISHQNINTISITSLIPLTSSDHSSFIIRNRRNELNTESYC